MKILVIEYNTELLQNIKNHLEDEGNVCEIARNYRSAYRKLGSFPYDILIVDTTLPDGSGLDIIKSAKKENIDVGIIIISDRVTVEDIIHGLKIGADDYLTKPFCIAELDARIKALYRRKVHKGGIEILFNEILIKPERYEVFVNKSRMVLTKKEFDIIHFFIVNKNRLLTKEIIAEHLWGDDIETVDSYKFIYTHMANLRKKITDLGGKDYIKSIYSVGYRFTDNE